MKTISILRPTAWAGLFTLVLGMQAALAQPLVYVPLGGEGKIVVIDAARDVIVDTIGGVSAVHGLAKTPDGRYLIAGSFDEREVGAAPVVKPEGVSEEDHAAHHAASKDKPDDAVVSSLSVIDTADGTTLRRIDVPGAVHHVAVSPDGRFAVVTQPNGDTITAVDLAGFKVVATIPTGSLPNYAVFSPDSARVYVSNTGDDTVSEIDTGTWTVRSAFAAGGSPEHMVVSADGTRLYVAGDGTVAEIETNGGATLRSFKAGSVLHGLDLSKDGKSLFVSALGDDRLVAIDLASGLVRAGLTMPAPYHLATIGAVGKIYVSSADQPDISVVDADSLSLITKIIIGGKGHQMVLSPGS